MKIQPRNLVHFIIFAGVLYCAVALVKAPFSHAQAPASQAPAWQPYRFPEDGFSISFPSKPQFNLTTGANSKLGMRKYSVDIAAKNPAGGSLVVHVLDLDESVLKKDPDQFLNQFLQNFIARYKCKLIRQQKITLRGHAGIEFEEEDASLHYVGRMYLDGPTLYQTTVSTRLGTAYPNARRFLASFQFIPHPANP